MTTFSIATNFDIGLLRIIEELNRKYPQSKVTEVYGTLPVDPVGNARSSHGLPSITTDEFIKYVQKAHEQGLTFNYLLNCVIRDVLKTDSVFLEEIKDHLSMLRTFGIHSVTITDEFLLDIAKDYFPEINISCVKGVDTVDEAKKLSDKGVKSITLNQHTANRNPQLICDIVHSVDCEVKLYANISCLDNCSKRDGHYKYLSSRSRCTVLLPKKDPYIQWCADSYLKYPIEFIKTPFIRPEDIDFYVNLGVSSFKLSDRKEPTSALAALLEAYQSREFHGNLFNLLFRDGRKWINGDNIEIPDIHIDNDKLTEIDYLKNVMQLKGDELKQFYKMARKEAVKIR